jgi:hypothetical protein
MAQSKNSRTSKPKEFIKPVKERKKKETILIEVTGDIYSQIKDNCLVEYKNKPIIECIRRYGKNYIRLSNI